MTDPSSPGPGPAASVRPGPTSAARLAALLAAAAPGTTVALDPSSLDPTEARRLAQHLALLAAIRSDVVAAYDLTADRLAVEAGPSVDRLAEALAEIDDATVAYLGGVS